MTMIRPPPCTLIGVGLCVLTTTRLLTFDVPPILAAMKPVATPNNNEILEDGCGIVQHGEQCRWSSYSENETRMFRAVERCTRQFPDTKPQRDAILQALRCNTNVSCDVLRKNVQLHPTMWFMGDSVMAQQFYVFVCMINPSVSPKNFTMYNATTNGSPNALTTAVLDYNHSKGTTRLLYSRFGLKWHPTEENLYKGAFPKAVESLSTNDAIILNANNHYNSPEGHLLEKAVRFIGNKSLVTNASVFYMEPAPEEWPTSNGMFTKSCSWFCKCEVLDSARLVGRGNHTDPNVNITVDLGRLPNPSTEFFQKLYPDLSFAENIKTCIPDCLPATWRMDLARWILNTTNHRVNLVPLWWQLTAKGTPSGANGNHGDCTHKSLEALMVMNQQLVRAMVQAK